MKPVDYIPSYIESLITLLVFVVTLPTIYLNQSSKELVIINRNSFWNRSDNPLNRFGALVGLSTVLSIIFLASFLVKTPALLCDPIGNGLWCEGRDFFYKHVSSIAFSILLCNIILIALYAVNLFSFSKTRLLSSLAKKCTTQAKTHNGHITRNYLEAFGELGASYDAGPDKEWVLDTLKDLASLRLATNTRAILARTIRNIVEGGNSINFIEGINVLQLNHKTGLNQQIDDNVDTFQREFFLGEILSELKDVMIMAMSLRDERIMATIMTGYDELTNQAPLNYAYAFMELGKTAISLYEFEQALTILDKFDTRVDFLLSTNNDSDIEAIHVYFGLLAHIWHSGESIQKYALRYINNLQERHKWNTEQLYEQFELAYQLFLSSDLETANFLDQMMYETKQRRQAKVLLANINIVEQATIEHILTNFPSIQTMREADKNSLVACGLNETEAHQLMHHLSPEKRGCFRLSFRP